ncbi:acyl-CoA dehydrogenase [Achromobacter marplatensis]|jgi:alkylation response protein AidB-like acyl-CoA dehydrogenase|uniref:Alkylation response protein AidB-like acyl-CoA dehydrogenase n=1 Tax=Achromobacter marplatensis TaxID=470868 RepID=A0ABX9G6A9_9BURK|nr:acyl-CoA dehydrogenase [Achromobacter marplatensis]OWT62281.1 acyl-CoA dehydrogenase [Achromobacter marplatensis]RBP16973.1 alkylation response protein AidB-like acyl-CoA dehydrogenase [Achromobacter marplatensis]CAB3631515.1 3-methylmercaptopropionyl-CoA dehydrogenase [Achromobacter marplatensis]
MTYQAPVKDMLFVLNHLAGLQQVAALPGFEEATPDTAQAVLEESAHFAAEVLAPLNHPADREPSAWRDGAVTTAAGFKQAFRQYTEAGWQGMSHPVEYGGQGLPGLIGSPCSEMLNAANLSFALCPLLTNGAIEALLTAGSPELKKRFIGPMISGQWTGTMNLTEPQAGSDLAMIRTRAQPVGDGTYRLSGTKIFITYGDHDLTENILHLVLARLPDAPEGVKGISLFLVPKFLVNEDGSLGARNDVTCVSIEHKLGIKASPTATLQFGDAGGALGYLVGQENRGLDAMFIMMNAARYAVGVQGIAIADRAYQHALAYAADRVQSRPVDGSSREAVAIIQHPDVRRMLGTMRALTEAGRALAYVTAGHADQAHAHPDADVRRRHLAVQEFLVPIVKGWCTEMSIDVASLGVQVHGGMGFIEETGAAQYYRDARILTIYEGTTAIQANDLVGRKTLRDGGAVAQALLEAIRQTESELESRSEPAANLVLKPLRQARLALANVVDFVLANAASAPNAVFGSAVPYLLLAGTTLAGWQMARALLVSLDHQQEDPEFHQAKIATVQCYALHKLTQAPGLAAVVLGSKDYEIQP